MPTNFRRLALGSALTLALAAAASLPLRAEIIEQVLVKVNGEIFTKSDLEQRQVLALRAQNRNVKPEDDQGRRRAAQDAQRGDAAGARRRHRRTAAPAARQGAGLLAVRRAVLADRRQHPQGEQARERGAVPRRAEAGRADPSRAPAQHRAADDRQPRPAAGRDGQDLGDRGGVGGLLRRAQGSVQHAGGGHAARDPGRRARSRAGGDRRSRPGRHQRRPRRRGQDQGGGAPPPHHRRRGLRAARRGELRRAVEGQRRPDRAGQPATRCRRSCWRW